MVLGLDNAGKTSLVKLVREKIVDFGNITPTLGIDRNESKILDKIVSIHDFGGQKGYRDGYLEKDVLFSEADVLVFVIDSKDMERLDLAIEYFESLIKIVQSIGLSPDFYLVIHKLDDKTEERIIPSRIRKISSAFENKANENGIKIKDVFKTSIYRDWTCIEAFHEIFSSVAIRLENVDQFLESIVEEMEGLRGALILDESGTMVARCNVEDEAAGRLLVRAFLEHKEDVKKLLPEKNPSVQISHDGKSVHMQKLHIAPELGSFFLVVWGELENYKILEKKIIDIKFTLERFL